MGKADDGQILCLNHFAIEFLQKFQNGKPNHYGIIRGGMFHASKFQQFIIRWDKYSKIYQISSSYYSNMQNKTN